MCADPRCSHDGKRRIVYVARLVTTDFYKIGIADDVKSRLMQIQTHSPFQVTLICTFQWTHPETLEKQLHFEFHEKLVRGEWFKLTEDDVKSFSDYTCFVPETERVSCGRRRKVLFEGLLN